MKIDDVQEKYVQVTGGRVWVQVIGSGDAVPLVTLHGGPGWPHDSLEPLGELADERPIVFYDQLGCGKSDRPDDASLWVIDRFIEELEEVRTALGYEKINILGHSWGTMLGTDYTLAYPDRVERLVLASPVLSVARFGQDSQRYCEKLPAEAREILQRHEAGEAVDPEDFSAAYREFSKRHFCRLNPTPEPMKRASASQNFGGVVYEAMQGTSELSVTGNLKTYERAERLGELAIPVLLTCGRYDEASPEATEYYQSLIPGAQIAIFENSAHVAFFEDQEAYLQTVREFLR